MILRILILLVCMLSPDVHARLLHHVRQQSRPPLTEGLFDLQLEVFACTAPRISLVCGRRGGKTTTGGRLAADALERFPADGEDESIIPVLAPTRGQAKKLYWGRLHTIDKHFRLGLKFNTTELIVQAPNGAKLWLMGYKDDRDVDRMRGFAFRRVLIDESQAAGADMEDMIEEVIDPACADHDAQIIMLGTPNAACRGYFHRASTGLLKTRAGLRQWKNFHWTVLDNPLFPRWRAKGRPLRPVDNWRDLARRWLQERREAKGWDEDHPSYLREWMARWTRDEGGLVYRYDRARNGDLVLPLPDGHDWQHVLGLDFGTNDAFTQHVWAFAPDHPDVFGVYTYKRSGLTVTDWAERIRETMERYRPIFTVGDTGGLGKAIVMELRKRFSLPIHAAEKKDKRATIDLFNDHMVASRIHIDPEGPLAEEMEILQWDEDRVKEDDAFQNDACDAALYGWRKCYNWSYKEPERIPQPGEEDWGAWQAKRMRELRLKKMKKRRRRHG